MLLKVLKGRGVFLCTFQRCASILLQDCRRASFCGCVWVDVGGSPCFGLSSEYKLQFVPSSELTLQSVSERNLIQRRFPDKLKFVL